MPFLVGRELVHSTVRLIATSADGDTAVGTGFMLGLGTRSDGRPAGLMLITNKHVIKDAINISMRLRLSDSNGDQAANGRSADVRLPPASMWLLHPEDSVDLAAIGIGGGLDTMVDKGTFPHITSIAEDLIAGESDLEDLYSGEDIVMIGYPNGIWDAVNNLPIMRRGITATAPAIDFDGDPVFMIDCASFHGSSGSPVFLYNPTSYRAGDNIQMGTRLKLIGILFAGPQLTANGQIVISPVPTAMSATVETKLTMNLGLCVKATKLKFFYDWAASHGAIQAPDQP